MSDVSIGSFVIPAVALSAAASVASAIWTHVSTKGFKKIESFLRQEEERFKLAQSPRVRGAIELWAAFCGYERWFHGLLSAMPAQKVPLGLPSSEWTRFREEQRRTQAAELERAWSALVAERGRAELLVPGEALAALDAVCKAYEDARNRYSFVATIGPIAPEFHQEVSREMVERFLEAGRLRPGALEAMRKVLT